MLVTFGEMEKAIPFLFGKIADLGNFTNRKNEIDLLNTNFSSKINTILISPRRWGKSSLVLKATSVAMRKDKKLKSCFIDMQNIRSEREFYSYFASEIIKCTSTKVEELVANAKDFLSRFVPKINMGIDPQSDFSLSLDWEEVKKSPDDILNLSEKIAKKKEITILVCIDEFQNISEFEDPLSFQKKLRSHWQKHQRTVYCIYGSKRHMMMEVFASPSMPFYKFGSLLFLQKISNQEWVKFIRKKFSETGKKIDKKEAELIAKLVECHPYYVQQLAQLSWLRTRGKCTAEIIHEAHEGLANQLSMLFQQITDSLSNTQINFLRALSDGVEKLSSSENLKKYNLGTSGNVVRIKEALQNKEIIEIQASEIFFLDPVYKHWLKTALFKQR